jgi:DNA mismatch repair protein MutL
MGLEDLATAVTAHSTSKITEAQDLQNISTLGFRGEALHSLAQLGQVQICSRKVTSVTGWLVQYNADGQFNQNPRAQPLAPGTVVTVQQLFAQHPTRRENLPSMAQQVRKVQRQIQDLALANPQITWQAKLDQKPWLSYWECQHTGELLLQMLPEAHPADLVYVHTAAYTPEIPEAAIEVVLGLPDRLSRRRMDWLRVAINGRVIHCPEIQQTILTAFANTLPKQRFPVCVVHLRVPPQQVDWNRHPAKQEVYLRDITTWQNALQKLITDALQHKRTDNSYQSLAFMQPLLPNLNSQNPRTSGNRQWGSELSLTDLAYGNQDGNRESPQRSRLQEGKNIYRLNAAWLDPAELQVPESQESINQAILSNTTTENSNPENFHPANHELTTGQIKVLAQILNTYILLERPDGIWLIEQHVAHERILFEMISAALMIVPCETPVMLQKLSPQALENLEQMGLDIAPLSEGLWAVRSIPELILYHEERGNILQEMSQCQDLYQAKATLACRSAIRNGVKLDRISQQQLVDQWRITPNPHTCPHGRPICLALAEADLARFFRRSWLVDRG